MNAVQYYMTKAGYGTSEALQTLALKPLPMDFSNVPAPQMVNGVIQTDLPHQPSPTPASSGDNNMTLYGHGDPTGVTTPQSLNQLYIDLDGPNYWLSSGLTVADWTAIGGITGRVTFDATNLSNFETSGDSVDSVFEFPNLLDCGSFGANNNPSLTDVLMPLIQTIGACNLSDNPNPTTYSFPNLVSVAGDFDIDSCALLNTFSCPNLLSCGGSLIMFSCHSLANVDLSNVATILGDIVSNDDIVLVTMDFSSLVTCISNVNFLACPLLAHFICPVWVPANGTTIAFNGDALDATSVELILRRCVLAGVTTCTIDLSGGTNAGIASLNAQGQADVVTLGAQLTINP